MRPPHQPRRGRRAGCDRPGRRDRRLRLPSPPERRVVAGLQSHKDPSVAMSGQVGSQIKTIVGNSWLIANVRTLRAGEAGELVAHVDFLGEGSRDAAGKMSNFRRGVTRYPIPGAEVLAGDDRGHARDLRGKRRAAYRDRHRLSDRRHPRRTLRRPDAGEAFRGPRLDRYRQVDLGLAHSSPHLRAVARGSHRDDRPARRIFSRVQGLRRIVQRRQSPAALLADELRGALRSSPDDRTMPSGSATPTFSPNACSPPAPRART